MTLWKHDIPGSSQFSSSVIEDERRRQPAHEKRVGQSSRLRGIDCMLADIEAQIRRLQQERSFLRLVRNGLANVNVRLKRTAPRHTLLKASRFWFEGYQKDQ